jgi:hypothetical protein
MTDEVKPAQETTVAATTETVAEKIYGEEKKEAAAEPAASEEKPAAEKTEETKTDEPVTGPPEKYELKLPENSRLDASEVEKAAAYAKAQGFSQEQAQQYLATRSEAVSDYMGKLTQDFEHESNKWIDKVKADKEIGGEKLNENLETVKRYFDKYGSKEFVEFIEQIPYRNHPELVRFFVKAAKDSKIMEDKLVMPSGQSAPMKKSRADILYGPGTEVKTN